MSEAAYIAEARAVSPPADAPYDGVPRVGAVQPPGPVPNQRAAPPGVLLVDDDADYRTDLCRYLRTNGFAVAALDNFADAQTWIRRAPGALVIVAELTVGARHLFHCIGQLRHADRAAVLVLSGRRDETDTIVALELGADDVIPKTAERREILARIRAAVRRLQGPPSDLRRPPPEPRRQPAAGAWAFSSPRRTLTDPEGCVVRLTHAEFNLLDAFVANAGKPLSRDFLSSRALGHPCRKGDRGIDNLVAKLRRKLRDSARDSGMIQTARSLGYVFAGFRPSPQ